MPTANQSAVSTAIANVNTTAATLASQLATLKAAIPALIAEANSSGGRAFTEVTVAGAPGGAHCADHEFLSSLESRFRLTDLATGATLWPK